jgi:hypothetical protein
MRMTYCDFGGNKTNNRNLLGWGEGSIVGWGRGLQVLPGARHTGGMPGLYMTAYAPTGRARPVCGNAQRREVPTRAVSLSLFLSRALQPTTSTARGPPQEGDTENTWLRGGQLIGGCIGIKPLFSYTKKKSGGGVWGSEQERRRGAARSGIWRVPAVQGPGKESRVPLTALQQ